MDGSGARDDECYITCFRFGDCMVWGGTIGTCTGTGTSRKGVFEHERRRR